MGICGLSASVPTKGSDPDTISTNNCPLGTLINNLPVLASISKSFPTAPTVTGAPSLTKIV